MVVDSVNAAESLTYSMSSVMGQGGDYNIIIFPLHGYA